MHYAENDGVHIYIGKTWTIHVNDISPLMVYLNSVKNAVYIYTYYQGMQYIYMCAFELYAQVPRSLG